MKGGIKPSELKKKIWFKVKIVGGGGGDFTLILLRRTKDQAYKYCK